jgi:hypothetical protein
MSVVLSDKALRAPKNGSSSCRIRAEDKRTVKETRRIDYAKPHEKVFRIFLEDFCSAFVHSSSAVVRVGFGNRPYSLVPEPRILKRFN